MKKLNKIWPVVAQAAGVLTLLVGVFVLFGIGISLVTTGVVVTAIGTAREGGLI